MGPGELQRFVSIKDEATVGPVLVAGEGVANTRSSIALSSAVLSGCLRTLLASHSR